MLAVEYAKMRRLRVGLVAAIPVLATLLLSSMSLFSASHRATINDPAGQHWEGTLLFYALVKALTAPLFVAVLASRQVEIEQVSNGWTLAALNGQRRGRLCWTKFVALAPVVVAASVAELGGLVLGSWAAGARLPVPVGAWVTYGATSLVVTLVLLAGHVWLAGAVDNQLISLGVGALGAFVGAFSLLMPPWLGHLLPWGYYGAMSPYAMSETGYGIVTPAWGWFVGYVLVGALAISAGLRRLDHQEV